MISLYFDMCALKRPFDDQSHPRIAASAVLALLQQVEDGKLRALRSGIHDLENSHNPDVRRATAVASWLRDRNPIQSTPEEVRATANLGHGLVIGTFDLLHLAWAEYLGAHFLVTTDARFVRQAERLAHKIRVRVLDPAKCCVRTGPSLSPQRFEAAVEPPPLRPALS